jgi:DUF1009 family protein
MEKLGLIAGNRRFPLLFSQAAKQKNYRIVAVAIKGDTSPSIKNYADKVYWLGLNQFSRMFEIFKQEGISRVVMAGQITPRRLFSLEVQQDPMLKSLLETIKDKKADTIFGAVADKLKEFGLELMDSTAFVADLMPEKGTLTREAPGFEVWEDIYFGLDLAKEIALLDIGQAVAVKHKAVVAVEAMEGTDNLIRRAGLITGGGAAIVKVSKPKQDLRFDIPVVGLQTVKNLVKAGASALAMKPERPFFIDQDLAVALADKHVCIVAV